MNYRRALLVRWSRRDRFSVLVVALTVGFLGGVPLWLVDAAGLLTVFGIRLLPGVDPWLVAGMAHATPGVALLGATIATLAVAATPVHLLCGNCATDGIRGGLDG